MKPSTTLILAALAACAPAQNYRLANRHVIAEFDANGLVALGPAKGERIRMSETPVALQIGGKRRESRPGRPVAKKGTLTYRTEAGPYRLETVYEIQPEWGFVSKRVRVLGATGKYTVQSVDALGMTLADGAKAHGAGGASAYLFEPSGGKNGLFVAQQNPFPVADLKAGLRLGYAPEMPWNAKDGAFETDRVLLGPWASKGTNVAMPTVPEWKYVPDPVAAVANSPQVDRGAYDAIRACVDAFVMVHPAKSLKVHIPWCENDYQIDLAKPDGPPQEERIIDQAKAMGCDAVLFTPQNSAVSTRAESNDAWGWESLLWLGYGPKIRKGEWDVSTGRIDPSVQHFLDYAKKRDVKLLAYVYPTLAWTQDPAWTAWAKEAGLPLGGYVGADTANRGFQDWFVDTLVKFCDRTGLAGVSFDHWWIAYDQKGASSRYAQWYGCRRILEELRKRRPDMIIDGRQQYQGFGPWTWIGGSYPHPTSSDEQPVSFRAFADLHTDRVSANRQRWASYWFTVRNFTPPVLNPGYITHQTQRNGPGGVFTTDDFRVKDWDVLGWRYSVLSSIGTAPYNSTVSMIPARSKEEFAAFAPAEAKWFADWLAWPDRHRDLIAHTRPILGQPMVGKVDGTTMIDRDHGFVFLFNPNYRAMKVSFTLDASIGLDAGDSFVVWQVEPDSRPVGRWRRGERVEIPMDGTSVVVLQIERAGVRPLQLLDASGEASIKSGILRVDGLKGAMGQRTTVRVALPRNANVKEAIANGQPVAFRTEGDVAMLDVAFAGEAFLPAQPVVAYDPTFSAKSASGTFLVPGWVNAQLARRKAAWPVSYTPDDLIAPWLGPDRLLLFVSIADAKDEMAPTLTIDGRTYPLKKAYNSVYKEPGNAGTFIGFYADVAALADGKRHTVEVGLPEGLAPGQFQGVYFDNVETERTERVVARP